MAWFQNIGIIAKQHQDPRVAATVERAAGKLQALGVRTRFEQATARLLGRTDGIEIEALGAHCDLVLVVGGDGTFLHAARELADFDLALVGINLGRLGFLVDILPDEIEDRLEQILSGAYDADSRILLDARMGEQSKPERALNDVVIHKWNSVRMIEFETYIDGRFVNAQRSDGLIVATPTGSTAYALSGGGPLIHPRLDALLLVPICPHTLSNRPLVIPGSSRIEIRLCSPDPEQVRLTCDGQIALPLRTGASIRIERSPRRIRLLHPRDHDHYRILRAKLGWGGHTQADTPC
ncbi:NAD(+) kinase [Halochromatium glycolicum]|uniref:NAD kinase n=1 Tax=Halochromatium glycolicum TaxID=85075 RepID=A0AAJ0U7V5_9GAMM|nr:NAD(+) kinase [Halochromatium glycolicum]MBK1706817.1 NAD kinase [Halochromatium glycolicum]